MSASLTIDGAVARLTLERPAALNALDRATLGALEGAQDELERADRVSVVIVGGRGRAFCAGNDIAEMPKLSGDDARDVSERWQQVVDRFARLPQVTIAAVRGYALGGGCMLAVAQDLRIAEASARFGLPEVTLGFNPSYGIARLIDVLGGAHARDLLLTGRRIDAAEALRIGLVNEVVPDGALDDAAAARAADIRAGRTGGEAQAYAASLRADPDARARIAAFVDKQDRRA